MGETISTLVFRPPPPTYLKPTRYFFIDIEQENKTGLGCSNTSCASTSGGSDEGIKTHRIPAFFIKRKGATLTLLFSHGNAEDLGMMYNRMRELARVLQVNVMAYDYTGYGHSTGSPSEEMCYRNIEAAYAYLRNVRNIAPSQIVLYGRSLGSGPSCHLAAKTAREGQSVAALVLHSPFLSVYRVVMDCGFNMVGDMFLNISHARAIRCPVLVIHGTKDEVVPFWHGQELLQTLPPQFRAQPFWAEGLGHNNIEVYLKKIFVARVTGFLDSYVPARKETPGDKPNAAVQQPVVVPEPERAVQDPAAIAESKFFVNQTWVKYGKQIINEAVTSKQKAMEVRKIQKLQQLDKDDPSVEQTVPQLQKQGQDNSLPVNSLSVDEPPPIFTTRTCDMIMPDADDPEEEDREDENTNSMNQPTRDEPDEKQSIAAGKMKKLSFNKRSASMKLTQVTGIKRLASKKQSRKR